MMAESSSADDKVLSNFCTRAAFNGQCMERYLRLDSVKIAERESNSSTGLSS